MANARLIQKLTSIDVKCYNKGCSQKVLVRQLATYNVKLRLLYSLAFVNLREVCAEIFCNVFIPIFALAV